MQSTKNIRFQFTANWRKFKQWLDIQESKNINPTWEKKTVIIEKLFNQEAPGIINWDKLWADFNKWYNKPANKKSWSHWPAQHREIEKLMLKQKDGLNDKKFILFYGSGKNVKSFNPSSYFEVIEKERELKKMKVKTKVVDLSKIL